MSRLLSCVALLILVASMRADDAVARGRQALLGRAFNPPAFSFAAYDNAWKVWGLKEKPADYDRLFRDRYGLHEAPYANDKYPMGLRAASSLLLGKGLTTDCLACHGGSIAGRSYVGLGNASGDFHALSSELSEADGRKARSKLQATRVRGTSEAFALDVFIMGLREPDLSIRTEWLDLGVDDELCEDTPAWWLLKKKKTMYHHGGMSTQSVRALMQFMLVPLNMRADFDREEKHFADIQKYLFSLQPPPYAFAIDRAKAAQGEKLFAKSCARCHGTYGEQWTYPNRIVPLDEIGTDPTRYHGLSKKFTDYYNTTWFAQSKDGPGHKGVRTNGYQAPPLDGIWATAPYFHNGAAPTVYHVLNSKARPKLFTRSYRTDKEDYDPVKLGWKVTLLEKSPGLDVPAIERRKVYDTTQRSRGNGGHTYGDALTDEERYALIEYLKTL